MALDIDAVDSDYRSGFGGVQYAAATDGDDPVRCHRHDLVGDFLNGGDRRVGSDEWQ